MRFVLKTNYGQDINHFLHNGQRFWYGLLIAALLLAPFFVDRFYVGELTYLLIWVIAGTGLMLLIGYTGLVSMGHAAFMAIGAYAHAVLFKLGFPFGISLLMAGLVSGFLGAVIGIAALRMTGIYLAVATISFAFIIEKIVGEWTSVTGGHRGFVVPEPVMFGIDFGSDMSFYYLCLGVVIVAVMLVLNLLRSPMGRAMIAVRDSEISAQAMGVNLVETKTLAFTLSAFFTGLAGALYSHKIGMLFPENFTIFMSIKLLILVVVGGIGSMHGIVFGAIFISILPQVIAIVRDFLPTVIAQRRGLEPLVFGSILLLFLIYEPLGLYGRWVKIRAYFTQFPLYRRATFKRQKSYLRTERVH
ncbi:MAG: branched-chain amino acid ABC transporter permease [Gammaproteobacteria bacterium]|nr:branched-chain amino acid ABC transporter permease [Gammaproteobacteria bacterium]